MTGDAELQRVLAQLRRQYIDEAPARLAELRAALSRAREGDLAALGDLRQLLHRLAGSGGSYGLDAVTEQARAGEAIAYAIAQRGGAPPSPAELGRLEERIQGVGRAFQEAG